jgi:hypothetical protein
MSIDLLIALGAVLVAFAVLMWALVKVVMK